MIVKNAAGIIGECLERLPDQISEINIIDTGSGDNTVEIASKFTDRIFNLEWPDNFSAARNFSLSKASLEWVMVLDSDEFLEYPEKVHDFLHGAADVNYWDCLHIPVSHEQIQWSDFPECIKDIRPREINRKPVLFRNSPRLKYKGRVHEELMINDFRATDTGLRIFNLCDTARTSEKDAFYRRLEVIEIEDGVLRENVVLLLLDSLLEENNLDAISQFFKKHEFFTIKHSRLFCERLAVKMARKRFLSGAESLLSILRRNFPDDNSIDDLLEKIRQARKQLE